jgi:zinc transport system ATP-binding protein
MTDRVCDIADVTLGYKRGRPVLEGASLRIAAGEFWFLLGQNGSGKTTLLRGILGLLKPWTGAIRLHPELAARSAIGFVPQRAEFNPGLPTTVREFVSLGLVGTGTRSELRESRFEWALSAVGLENLASVDYHRLSGGQRQRALLARALIREPAFLILDEPTAGLDVPSQEAFYSCLEFLHRRKELTLLFITHDLLPAARFASHLALCVERTVVAGERARILTPDLLRRTYGVRIEISHQQGVTRLALKEEGSRNASTA